MAENTEIIDFVWQGTDKSGKRTKGEISDRNVTIARTTLRQRGIRVIKIKPKPKDLFSAKKTAISSSDIAVFSRQLATMLGAGVPLVKSFDIIGNGHENASMQELLMTIKADIESGRTLTEGLRKHNVYFDDLFCNLVQAGEHAGILESLLDKIATYKEKTDSLKKKIKKALVYPSAIIFVSIIVTAILLLFVVPVFEELFQNFGADLPLFTQTVINASKWLQEWWWFCLLIVIFAALTFNYFRKRSYRFNYFMNKLYLKIPVFGTMLHNAAIARFARTLGTMSTAGVPLLDALGSVAGATGNIVYSNAVQKIRKDVAGGQQLQSSMQKQNLFPHMIIQMVSVGEESGRLDSMLNKIADFYEEAVDNAVDNLSSLLEPLIMVVLGVLIGGLVIAMYLPIFKLGSVF